jgi:hypothetical protein
MFDRLLYTSMTIVTLAAIVLILFLPARSYLYRRYPKLREADPVPNWLVWFWLGGPIACVYGFAVHPNLGVSLTIMFFVSMYALRIRERVTMPPEDRERFDQAMDEFYNRPLPKLALVVTYVLLACIALSVLFETFG